MGSGMGVTPFLQINKRGDRFMNECIPGQQLENQIELQPECTSFQLYDSKWGEEVPYMPANHGGLCYIIPEDEDESNPNYTDRQYTKISAKAEAYQFKADTLEDLLTQCGFEGDALDNALASVERYNELYDKQEDEDFGKEDYRLSTLSEAPFYGVRQAGGYLICTIDGIQIDDNMHAIDHDFKAIPGLYVIGDMSGNYFSGSYPCLMAGAAAGRSATFGRFAGQNAAAGI